MNSVVKQQLPYWLVLLVIIGVELAYRKPLFDYSFTAIKTIQANSTKAGIFTFEAFSFVGAGALYFVVFIVLFNCDSRARAFYHILFLTACIFVMNITKMAYFEPRPYFVDIDIVPHGCSAEFGNPSGHSIFAAAFLTFLFLDVFEDPQVRRYSRQAKVYIGSLFLTFSMIVLIGFARLYVGLHTINQIVYGWLLGLWMAFYFHYCIRQPINLHVSFLTESEKNHGQYTLKYLLIAISLFLITFMG